MGTVRYIQAPDGSDVPLDDHEGYLEFALDEPVTVRFLDTSSTYSGWTSSWTGEINEHRVGVRAACACGWCGPELPWRQGVIETDAQRAILMLPWDHHLNEDVIQDLAWSVCGECGDPFPQTGIGRPRKFCGDACRQANYRERVR